MTDTSSLQGRTAAYLTLGCKLNFSETATFGRRLSELGVRTAEKGEPADICIVNTCSVTDVADRKSRQAINRLIRQNPGAFVVVTGCYAQMSPETIAAMPGVSLVVGNQEKKHLVDYIADAFAAGGPTGEAAIRHTPRVKDITEFSPSCSRGNRTRFFLKVQDGCDYFCTYCTIPFARGRSRNPSIASLVAQAEEAAREGGREVVLTGVNIGDFGKTTGESFLDLVKALDGVEGISRYRISSLEPDLLSDELLQYCATESRAFMPHFHIPLQSGSDTVLRLMHRHYDAALFEHKVMRIKELMPDAFIGVDVMVGCRGETEDCFNETLRLLERLPVSELHVFPYSERPGTAALRIPFVVDKAEREKRVDTLLHLSEKKLFEFYGQYQCSEAEVLLEKAQKGRAMHGFTRNYVRVELPARYSSPALDNTIVNMFLDDFNHDNSALTGHILDPEND